MKRFIKVLSVASMSSVYVMQVPCTAAGDGVTILPNVPSLQAFLGGLPLIGGLL